MQTKSPVRAERLRRHRAKRATTSSPRSRSVLVWVAAVLLLGQLAVAMVWSSLDDAPSYDEPAHIAAGVDYVRHHRLRLNYEHPPLLKALSGAAVVASGAKLPAEAVFAEREQTKAGQAILYESGNDPGRVLLAARLPMMLLTVALACAVFGFAAELFGAPAALLPLALISFDPSVIGHGRMVTTDTGVTLFLLLTVWCLYRIQRRPLLWAGLAGVAFGLALASKFTALLAAPVVAGLAVWAGIAAGRGRGWVRALGTGAAVAAGVGGIAVAVVWAVYLAVDPRLEFNAVVAPVPGVMGTAAGWLPLPEPYRTGLRFVLYYDQVLRPAYLFGEFYRGAKPEFYPAVLALKTPLAALAAWALALVALAMRPGRRAAAVFVLAVPVVLLALAITSHTNIGYRHVLAVPVFAAVLTGAVAAWRPPRVALTVAVVLALAAGVSAWRVQPAPLAYVNEAFGGPGDGWKLVADSNLDWGQDLARAAAWVRAERPGRPVHLLYFGTGVPSAYGLDATPVQPRGDEPPPAAGVVLVSASALALYDNPATRMLRQRTPDAQIGHSILVYDLP
jgi:hypothetical protein